MLYPVTEKFFSIQGEGAWTGTPFAFVRLAMCPVGKLTGICTSWDGKEFICDTGPSYQSKGKSEWHAYTEINSKETAEHIADWAISAGYQHLCLSGGETLSYDLYPFCLWLYEAHKSPTTKTFQIHVETSGTVVPKIHFEELLTQQQLGRLWVTLSPKEGWHTKMLRLANEVKLLVHKDTKEEEIEKWLSVVPPSVHFYVQPIEDEHWKDNSAQAVFFCRAYPSRVKLSLQTHKLLDVR